ncbi:MAG TPA: hypothetical protein VFQ84_01855 [Arenimonas sp.]|uniref:hypothetical protein n=1 Tax=Arenimonas sp. TaxID=1872635 RepID=UPI002D7FFF80|nr:hypothetical protein [Arenimonas sp.]HEU0152068.1 hypothetical protein [Arenimonas sp.]
MDDYGDTPAAASPVAVELLDHYDLADQPGRTLQALQVFFPGKAIEYFAALQVGGVVRVDDPVFVDLVGQLAAQGFRVRLVG